MNTFEEESMKVLEEDMNLESVDDTKKIRQAADNLEKAVNNYLENILKLNEDNIKVLETLDLPEEYKRIEKIAEMAENIEKSLTDREEEVTEEIKKISNELVNRTEEL